MSKTRLNYDEDFKKNAVKLSYAIPKTIKNFATDLGINVSFIYNWRKSYFAYIEGFYNMRRTKMARLS